MTRTFVTALLFFAVCGAFAQQEPTLIMNATAHLGNDSVIAQSLIGIHQGKIILVADATTAKVDMTFYKARIDASGKHVYPGLIAPNSTVGLQEIESVRATIDYREVGTTLPNVRSLIAYNTDSKIIPTIRTNGVLTVQVTPRGGLVSGTSSIVCLEGWNWEDAAYLTDDGIHVNWPRMQQRSRREEESKDAGRIYDKMVAELYDLFGDARAYSESGSRQEQNLRLASMSGLFTGTQRLYIHCNFVKEITEAVAFATANRITRLVIVGGKDAWMVTDLLKKHNVAVVLPRVHDLPERADEDVDLPFRLAGLLEKAGVLYCINNEGDQEATGARNLPFMAGTLAAYGLTREQALRAVTLNAAKILGIDKTTGSIETGKDATLFISAGDALDMRTNLLEAAWIRGVAISLTNEQQELYERYRTRYGVK